jgi:ADP-ribosylglycohydrolase
MYGAILGDICGSIYEWNNVVTDTPENIQLLNPKCYFTDDSILTVAIGEAILTNNDYKTSLLTWSKKYPNQGYGIRFKQWFLSTNQKPYKSYGNGSAMRVGSIGWAFNDLDQTIRESANSALVTLNHKEGVKGAMAVAAAIFLARNGESKDKIKSSIENNFGYNLNRNPLKSPHLFPINVGTCQNTVPPAFTAFLESDSFETALQIAISYGGDSDTLACIAGSIAEAFYKYIPPSLILFANKKLPDDMKNVIQLFYRRFLLGYGLDYYGTGNKIDLSV